MVLKKGGNPVKPFEYRGSATRLEDEKKVGRWPKLFQEKLFFPRKHFTLLHSSALKAYLGYFFQTDRHKE